MAFTLDPKRSSVRLRTFAEGLFSRLAHDLELRCGGLSGTAADERSATIVVPVLGITVAGTLKNDEVDATGLSPSDQADCLSKMRREVFHVRGSEDAVRVEAALDRVRVIPPNGKTVERKVALVPKKQDDGALRVQGTIALSLREIGSDPVKGPMNAFRVKDDVEVLFDVVFQPA